MRASRLLAILILLQLRGRLTGDYLASEFEVSLRTIYRDIDALSAAGVPVYGDKGPGGGFALLDGYRTQLTGLDPAEAEAMLFVGMPDQAVALGMGQAASRAREKLMAALSGAGREQAARIAGRFHLDTMDWYRSRRPTPHLATVARALLDCRQLEMTYQSWTARREWRVNPLGLVLKAGDWYLVAEQHGARRTFNVADIIALALTDSAFVPPPDFALDRWWVESQRNFEARLRPGKAVLRASPLGQRRLHLQGAFAAEAVALADEPDALGWCRLVLPLESITEAAPMLLGIGPEIEVIAPDDLRAEIARLALEVVSRMEKKQQ